MDAPHVVMLVANDARADVRVQKVARAVVQAGYRVCVLAADREARRRDETTLEGASLVRLPLATDHAGPRRDKARYVRRRGRLRALERWFAAMRAGRRPSAVIGAAGVRGAHLAGRLLERRYRRRREHAAEASKRGSRLLPAWRDGAATRSHLVDLEVAFGEELDRLRPRVVHAHDVMTIGVAVRAARRAHVRGDRLAVVYDAHEYVAGLDHLPRQVMRAYRRHEARHAPAADAVVAVSDALASRLHEELRLVRPPVVVMNVPDTEAAVSTASVRTAAGVDDNVRLAVYSGGLNASRGLETIVRALPAVPDLHVALVTKGGGSELARLTDIATQLQVSDRLHHVPFVPPNEVIGYLSSADIGLHPLLRTGNHEVALTNKLFDYLHARLAVLVSDLEASGDFVHERGIGEVFEPGDVSAAAEGLRRLTQNLPLYRTQLDTMAEQIGERYSWGTQVERLLEVYARLGLPPGDRPSHRRDRASPHPQDVATPGRPAPSRVGIGPRNMAGQGTAWARVLRDAGHDVEVFAVDRPGGLSFDADLRIPRASWESLDWQLARVREVLASFSHLLLESGSGAFGTLNGGRLVHDLPALRQHGIRVAAVCHGSEVRDPRNHAERERFSPFRDPTAGWVRQLQELADELRAELASLDVPVFVTTLGLCDDVPGASWLPVVVDAARLGEFDRHPPLSRDRVRILHMPSSGRLKGRDEVERALRPLAEGGHVELLLPDHVPPDQVPTLLGSVDVVVDGLLLGDYGVTACESMAAGRVVFGNVSERVRERLPALLPIVQATPETLREEVEALLVDHDRAATLGVQGRRFVRDYHSAAAALQRLSGFLAS